MKHYKTVISENKVLDHISCDKCGDRIDRIVRNYNAFEPNVLNIKEGKLYPEYPSSDYKEYKLDLCYRCAKDLIELLKKFSYQIREEYDIDL